MCVCVYFFLFSSSTEIPEFFPLSIGSFGVNIFVIPLLFKLKIIMANKGDDTFEISL